MSASTYRTRHSFSVTLGRRAGQGAPLARHYEESQVKKEAMPFTFKAGVSGAQLSHEGAPLVRSPEEGLWSVALDFIEGKPTAWQHAHPDSITRAQDWTIAAGRLSLDCGEWHFRDAYRLEGTRLKCVRRSEWHGEAPLGTCTLAIRWRVSRQDAQALLPGILYFGNPSGEKSGKVAVLHGEAGETALFEEHRYPMPFASLEWNGDSGPMGAALHMIPSPVPGAAREDLWWSLGCAYGDGYAELAAYSGYCAANGRDGVVKGRQDGFLDYPRACMTVTPGAIIEKTFYLELYPVVRAGSGLFTPVRTSLDIFRPTPEGMPPMRDIVEAKYAYACSRYRESEKDAGMLFVDSGEPKYVYGWCGQTAAAGYFFQVLAEAMGDPDGVRKAKRLLDHFATSPINDQGFMTEYDPANGEWSRQPRVSQGQALDNLAKGITYADRHSPSSTSEWKRFFRDACAVHAARILADDWHPESSNDACFISPLCAAAGLFSDDTFRCAAVKAADHYMRRHLSLGEPYWGGTLDASCEDKEGAAACLIGFLAVYDLTGEKQFLDASTHALFVCLTYLQVWDIPMPPGRLADHGFKSRGCTAVSVQNMHLDVWAVFLAPTVHRMGTLIGMTELHDLAILMYRACGQLIDPHGSQGEQIQQTNYQQRRSGHVELESMRGDYVERWTVFWITACFLKAAAEFAELGVD